MFILHYEVEQLLNCNNYKIYKCFNFFLCYYFEISSITFKINYKSQLILKIKY